MAMENNEQMNKEKILLDFLLEDFKRMKSEITRRSNLQKAAIAALLALYAGIFTSEKIGIYDVLASWGAALLIAAYIYREHNEIARLGWTIKSEIASQVGTVIGVDQRMVIPSEAQAEEPRNKSLI